MIEFIDLSVVVYGTLATTAIIATIVTLTPKKPKMEFSEWYSQVEKLFLENGFSASQVEELNKRKLQRSYDEGLNPEQAFEEYLYM